MIVAGVDIGSRGSKTVIMQDGRMLSYSICETGPESAKSAYLTMNEALKGTVLSLTDIEYVVGTGYGRVLIPFANENISEISCHAKGANWFLPSVRTILDMGGQDCKAINVDEKGRVTRFIMNDKCAGGTGRFLEVMADVLQVPLQEIGPMALQSRENIPFNTICAVFAKSEALSLLKKGTHESDILAGLYSAIATRCHNLLKRISIDSEFTITGGIAKNTGMVKTLEDKLGMKALLAEDPQIAGAVGAALFAAERLAAKQKQGVAS
ncbi:MAG: acyl-CoA dehydratase activase [Dehalococcoidia bacterium]